MMTWGQKRPSDKQKLQDGTLFPDRPAVLCVYSPSGVGTAASVELVASSSRRMCAESHYPSPLSLAAEGAKRKEADGPPPEADGPPPTRASTIPPLLCVFADFFGLAMLQPTLPFYLADISAGNIEIWTGAILSVQFIAVIPGNLVWGYLTDRLGSRRCLQITMLGDTMCFFATAFCAHPAALLGVRACAGFCSPLVPALAYVFEHVPAKDAVKTMGQYGVCVMAAYLVGAGAIASVYPTIHWQGVNLLSTSVAAVAILPISLTPTPAKFDRPRSQGVTEALRSAKVPKRDLTAKQNQPIQ